MTHRITVPLRYEADFNDRAYKATKDIFSLNQAVLPSPRGTLCLRCGCTGRRSIRPRSSTALGSRRR
ncbi:MAG: hypothetical protein JO139_06140 [Alphaproteobacteria bacterium]|nr:hypothetical protein [Alphaproteobacteria bacterium]